MMRLLMRMILVATLWSALPPVAVAQDGISKKQFEKNQAKKKKEDAKARKTKEKEDRKHHLSIQDKESRKRIKRNLKHADKGKPGAPRDRFPRTLFKRKR